MSYTVYPIRYTEIMEQHPLPRQITSFEFKLVGFMTLHQFIYLLVFVPMGFAIYKIIPIPFLNALLGFIISAFGVLLAFLPVNDRPLDVFIKNLYKRLTSPTQYLYKKTNQPPSFLNETQASADSKDVAAHIDSQEKLTEYLQTQQSITEAPVDISPNTTKEADVIKEPAPKNIATKLPQVVVKPDQITPPTTEHQPFFIGVVKNNKAKPLPEILVYVKDEKNNPVRLLKTNPNGVFATYSSLPQGEYLIDAKDPRGSYLFDTMKIQLSAANPTPFTMLSKGIL